MTNAEYLAKYQAKLEIWELAEETIATTGQSYMLDDGDMKRTLTSANLSEVAKRISYYQNKIAFYENLIKNNGRTRRIVFCRGR
jgi:hypothetical protein